MLGQEHSFNGLHSCICNFSFDGGSIIIVPKVARFPLVLWMKALPQCGMLLWIVFPCSHDECKATVWKIATGDLILTLCGHTAPVASVAEAPFGVSRPDEARVPLTRRSTNDAGGGRVKRICR